MMKQFRLPAAMALLLAMLFLCGGFARSEAIMPATGPRVPEKIGNLEAIGLAVKYGLDVDDWPPLYTPASSQPMNAYIMSHPEGKNVRDDYRSTCAKHITKATDGAIRFVSDPDKVDIFIAVKLTYSFAGNYTANSGFNWIKVHAATVELTAWRPADPDDFASMTLKNSPGKTVRVGNILRNFYMDPPKLPNTKAFNGFVSELLSWYGYGKDFNDIQAMIAHYYPVAE